MNGVNIKKNDNVLVLAGKYAGKTGKVLSVSVKNGTVKVDGINIQKKHQKARSAQQTGGILDQVGAIDISNVQVICDACGKATRIASKVDEGTGKKVRVCKKCGAVLDKGKEVQEAKKAAKKASKKTTKNKETAEKAE